LDLIKHKHFLLFKRLILYQESDFYHQHIKLLKDRTHFILSPIKESGQSIVLIDEDSVGENLSVQFGSTRFAFSVLPAGDVNMKSENCFAYFDYAQLQFPLSIRYKRTGDYFYPFGMKNKKKK
jgi:tRNA(Ile)-lysidine synthase